MTTTPDEHAYLQLLDEIIQKGTFKGAERTGVGAWSLFGRSLRFDLRNGRLPMLTTKKVYFKGVAKELLWFLKGDCTRTDALVQDNVHIWDLNSTRAYLDARGLTEYAEGELGPVYGYQWRHWGKPYSNKESNNKGSEKGSEKGFDQIQRIIDTIRNDPDDRRMILSAWNVSDLDRMALPPCHMFAQFYVRTENNKKYLSCAMYQRSADMFLGVPFNITSYALLTHMIAHVTDCEPDELVMFFGDTHVYANHLEQVKTQLERSDQGYPFPTLRIVTETNDIDQITYADLKVESYQCHDTIQAPMAV